ncbi:E3 SUMO-protein ligase ZNF451 isoform X2 [Engraulis encrasicolus]|uniref:E3 SUMO-protein ligase ZNF451 isoform X2 n=1 Tax=Engraulis encrasicolus TaxID=184585 RepID=UPI002FD53C8D
MSSDAVDVDDVEDDDVEFVSEGPLRPVLEFIDLSSDDDKESSEIARADVKAEDEVDQHKAQVTSTLDRLARKVAAEKQERADKCKAFKRKVISQQAHGRQELAFSDGNGEGHDAKRCVDMWLKMPGVKPGVINNGGGWRRRSAASAAMFKASPQTCPVINCGRVYENKALLEGHLIRFDHSPCDPSILLKGNPSVQFACVACGSYFDTKDSWRTHQQAKISSSNPGNHRSSQTCQQMVAFACPSCCLLFNIKEECHQHMTEKDHFTECIRGFASKDVATPVPVPRYAKNRLIALCKDVTSSVRCSGCKKRLASHMEARAHFNVHCRNATAMAVAEQTVAEVMRQRMGVLGRCTACPKLFHKPFQMDEHKQQTAHHVELTGCMEKALLHYSDVQETLQLAGRAPGAPAAGSSTPGAGPSKRARGQTESPQGSSQDTPAKRKKRTASADGGLPGSGGGVELTTVWSCECGQRFPEEAQATAHLLAVNQVFHKCAVCGKLMGEASITRLHMSRFHGGAHLSNFLLHCRPCRLDLPRMQDIMAHVAAEHQGHTFYLEKQEEAIAAAGVGAGGKAQIHPLLDEAASTSSGGGGGAGAASAASASPLPDQQTWLCRMCEELFETEAAVQAHCGDMAAHSFQRLACALCPQKFFKEATLRRHVFTEHQSLEPAAATRYFCGLCDSMLFDTEDEFQQHYSSIHAKDYYCLEPAPQPSTSTATSTSTGTTAASPATARTTAKRHTEPHPEHQKRQRQQQQQQQRAPAAAAAAVVVEDDDDADPDSTTSDPDGLCGCMAVELPKEGAKAVYTRCMKQLASELKCFYSCGFCVQQAPSYAQIKTHVHTKHSTAVAKHAANATPNKGFSVVCGTCSEKHDDVPAFHSHYHAQHCPLEPCASARSQIPDEEVVETVEASTSAKILHAQEILPEKNAEEFQDVKRAMSIVSPLKEDKKSDDESDEELKRALALSEEEAKKPTPFDNDTCMQEHDPKIELEEALRRSLEEF